MRLKISFEQTVAERDREQSDACDGQIQRQVADRRGRRNRDQQIACRHNYQSRQNRPLVVSGLVGDQAAHERENVDRKVKYRIDNAGVGFVEPEFGHQEQGQNRHHRVETEPFPHVGQRSRQQSLRMVFEHSQIGFMSFGFVSIRQIYDKIFVYIARSVKFA